MTDVHNSDRVILFISLIKQDVKTILNYVKGLNMSRRGKGDEYEPIPVMDAMYRLNNLIEREEHR